MLGEDVLARARARLAQPAFAPAAIRLRAALREDLVAPLLVPPPHRPAGYYHDYFCPQHGVQLEFDWASPRAHRCPVDGAVFHGDPYDRSWWWFVNHANSEAAFRLALGWRLDGQEACLDRLLAILGAYSADYREAGWPKDDPRGRQGKVTFHALDEAVWLIPLAWAYDVARPALSAPTRRDVEENLLLPAAEHLLTQRWQGVHNYMCWLNSGVGAAATLLERRDMVAQVIDGPFGFHQQVAEGVLADGTWWEGSASYHFYTLAALLAMARSVESGPASAALWRLPKLRGMFLAPLRWAFPDLSLPAINDCWYHSSLVGEVGHGIPPAAAFYEIAAGRYGDPALGAVLEANYGRGRARDSVEALLFGPDAVGSITVGPDAVGLETVARDGVGPETVSPDAVGPETVGPDASGSAARGGRRPRPRLLTASVDVPDFGVAILRGPDPRGGIGPPEAPGTTAAPSPGSDADSSDADSRDADRRTFLLLKYGAHGGGHGHPDKLGIILYSHGERLSPDLGTPGYGIALNDAWYRHTLSHNTVLIEGQPQPPATGRLRGFAPLRRQAGRQRPSGSGGQGGAHGLACGVIDAEVKWPATLDAGVYAGARLRRRILFRPDYFIDVCTVSCPQPRLIEWAYHNRGTLTHFGAATGEQESDQPEVAVPETLQLRAALPGQRDASVAFATGAAGLDLWLQGMALDAGRAAQGERAIESSGSPGTSSPADVRPSWVLVAEAPGNPASEPLPLILRRCVGASATFAAVFHPHGGPFGGPSGDRRGVRAVSWPLAPDPEDAAGAPDTLACEVTTRRGVERWDIPLHGTAAPRLVIVP